MLFRSTIISSGFNNIVWSKLSGHSRSKQIFNTYEIQKLIIEKNIKWLLYLTSNEVKLHKYIIEEYPEECISGELGFFD